MFRYQLMDKAEPVPPRSLFIFAHDNVIRIKTLQIVTTKVFDNTVLFLIFISSILLALDNPLEDPQGTKYLVLSVFDDILTMMFLVEFLLKVVALGFVLHKGSYLRDSWSTFIYPLPPHTLIPHTLIPHTLIRASPSPPPSPSPFLAIYRTP